MITIEFGPNEFDKHGFVPIGTVVSAIAKILLENGASNRFQAERDAWPHIHTAVVMGKLHLLAPETLAPLSAEDYGNGVVLFDELIEWGHTSKKFAFIAAMPDSEEDGAGATTAAPSLKELRIAAIVRIAMQLGYDPLCVATGGKEIIKAECLDKLKGDPHRFTADTFKKVWQEARNAKQIDVENVKTYRGQ